MPKPSLQKPSLQLIHCSNGIRRSAKRRQDGSGFQPFVIAGGMQSMPGERSWQAAFGLIGVGFLVSYASYLALLEVSAAVLAGSDWMDHEKNS